MGQNELHNREAGEEEGGGEALAGTEQSETKEGRRVIRVIRMVKLDPDTLWR